MLRIFGCLLFSWSAAAAIHTLSLTKVVELALRQNPDLALARIDEQSALEAVKVARDPFTPRINVGSGLAYSNGFPMSIEGAAPSIVQARASQYLFNRPQSYAVAQAKENARGAAIGAAGKRDEVVFRVASLYLDAERAARVAALARKELESLEKVAGTIEAAVEEGRELPLNAKRARYNAARAKQAIESLDADQMTAESNLALALGYSADDTVRPVDEERQPLRLPANEDDAVRAALESSLQLKQLQSQIAAKDLEIRGERSAHLPRVDLVAQYGLFARFNHYEDYYSTFQRHNGQIGVSIQVPVLAGPGVRAQVAQTQGEVARLRLELANARNRTASDIRKAYRDSHHAETSKEVARLDLEVAREQVSVLLAQSQEGRAGLRQIEEARVSENDKWIAYYDAQYSVERARLALLRYTGEIAAAIAGR